MKLGITVLFLFVATIFSAEAADTYVTDVILRKNPTPLPRLDGKVGQNFSDMWYGDMKTYRRRRLDPAGKVILDAVFNHDEFGFRASKPVLGKKSKHLFLGGCSFTYGDGVNDEQTYASNLATALPNWKVLNMGRGGGSPREAYYVWSQFDLRAMDFPAEGVFIYNLIYYQHERVIPTWRVWDWIEQNSPVFEREGEKFVNPVPASSRWEWSVARFFYNYNMRPYWLRLTSLYSDYESLGAEQLTIDYLLALKQAYLKQFPQGRFIVSRFAYQFFVEKEKGDHAYTEKMRKAGLEVWELSRDNWMRDHKVYFIPVDGHPSVLGHELQAKEILQAGQGVFKN